MLNYNFSLSETWLKSCDRIHFQFRITNTNMRLEDVNGEAVLDNIPYTLRGDYTFDKYNFKSIFMEVNKSTFGLKRNVIIGVLYRPPSSNIDNFNIYLHRIVEKINKDKKYCYLLGDYNIKTCLHNSCYQYQEILSATYYLVRLKLINKPTLKTNHSSTYLTTYIILM